MRKIGSVQVTFQTDYKDYQAFERAVKALPLRGLAPFVFFVVCLEIAAALSDSDLQMRVELWVGKRLSRSFGCWQQHSHFLG